MITASAYSPVRIRRNYTLLYWMLGPLLLLSLQLLTGTDPLFAGLVLIFTVLFSLTLRLLNGIKTLTGCCVFFFGMQNIVVSQFAKVYFGEPAESRLVVPTITMAVYDLFMFGVLCGVLTLRKPFFARRRPLFMPEMNPQKLRWMAFFFTLLALAQVVVGHTLGINSDTGDANVGGPVGMLHQIPGVIALAVACGTAYEIIASEGRKSLGITNGFIIVFTFLFGVVDAGREKMITAVLVYFITCIAFRFRFRPRHYVIMASLAYIAQFILFPYALYGRDIVRTPRFEENIRRASVLFVDVVENPLKFQTILEQKGEKYHSQFNYFPIPNATLQRSSLIPTNAGIVDATLRDGTTGLGTLALGFEMAVPRFLLPDKAVLGNSNQLAHREPGLVGKHDFTTGITIGPASDAFSMAGWPGVFLLAYFLALFYFGAFRYVTGDSLYRNVFPLGLVFTLPWSFSGAPIATMITSVLQAAPVYAGTIAFIYLLTSFMMRIQARFREANHQTPRLSRAEQVLKKMAATKTG